MSQSHNHRQASFDEVVAEMDRRGAVIERLEARVAELEAELSRKKPFEPWWDNPDGPNAA